MFSSPFCVKEVPLNERIVSKISILLSPGKKIFWLCFLEIEKIIDSNACVLKLFYYLSVSKSVCHHNEWEKFQIIWCHNTTIVFCIWLCNLGYITQKEFKVLSDIIIPELLCYHPLMWKNYSVFITTHT